MSENMLKGRMAETLVEELLKDSGNVVYRFGYEAIIQNLTQLKKTFDRHSDAGERIRAIPDFIVVGTDDTPAFVEVKFRWDGKAHADDVARLRRINEFWNAKIIIVNAVERPFFRVSKPPYLGKKDDFVCVPLLEEGSWKIDKLKYDNSEQLVERYLSKAI